MVSHLLLFVKGVRGEICKFSRLLLFCEKGAKKAVDKRFLSVYNIKAFARVLEW